MLSERLKKTLLSIANNKWAYLIYALLLFFITYFLVSALYHPRGKALDDWQISGSERAEKVDLPFYRLLNRPEKISIETGIKYQKGDLLALPRISGNRLEISLNGRLIKSIGGSAGTGNIWAQYHWANLPGAEAGSEARLSLHLYGVYDLGVREVPFIANEASVSLFRFITGFAFSHFYWLVTGLMAGFIVFLFNYAVFDRNLRSSYLLIIAGISFSFFYLFDLIYREGSGSLAQYLMLRKLFLIAGFNSTWFLLAGIEHYLIKRLRISRWLLIGLAANALLIGLQPDFAALKRVTVISALIAYASLLVLFYISIRRGIRPLIFSLGFFLMTLLATMVSLLVPRYHIILLQVGYLFASISVAYTVLNEFRLLQASIRKVTDKAMPDPLTGAYNRFFLEQLETDPGDVIILTDMNDFKLVNDRYGHSLGDTVLKEWVNTVREHIRDHDPIIRLGGDEFLIVLKGAKPNMMQAIKKKFRERFAEMPVSFSYGIQTIETNLQEAIEKADSRMYQNKELDKN